MPFNKLLDLLSILRYFIGYHLPMLKPCIFKWQDLNFNLNADKNNRNWPVSISRHVNPNKPVYANTNSGGTSEASFEHLQSSLGCFVLGCLLAGPLAGAADLSDGDTEREVGLVGLSLGLQQVINWGLAYPRSILLQQTDGRLSGIHSQHLLNTKKKLTVMTACLKRLD